MNLYNFFVNLLGYDNFLKGRTYPYPYIKRLKIEKLEETYLHHFQVKSERTKKYYDVTIENNGTFIKNYTCTCPQYKKEQCCKHISAALMSHCRDIFEYEIIDELKASRVILSKYKNIDKTTNIRKKMNIDVNFEPGDNGFYIKLIIGVDKKYNLSTYNKLLNFLQAYYNEDNYEFGKLLTYDKKEHYFDETDKNILNYLIECFNKRNNYYSTPYLNEHEFLSVIKLLNGRSFTITNCGKVNKIINGMPTEYYLTKEDNKYILKIDDIDKYIFLNKEKKYVYYDENLYILNKEDSEFINLLEKNKISNLTFESKDLNKFSNGLFNKIKNNISIDENVEELEVPTKPNTKLYFDISYNNLKCDIVFNYKDKEINYFEVTNTLRDVEEEIKIVNEIIGLGFIENNKSFIMKDEDDIYTFLDENLNELANKYEIFTSKKIDNTNFIKKTRTNNNFSIGEDGIMSYNFSIDGINKDEYSNLFSALKQKKKYYKLKNNNVVKLDDNELNNLSNLLDELEISKNDINQGEANVPKYRALYIDSLKKNKYKNIQTNNLFEEFIDNFKKYKNLEITFDKDDEILRDYQKEGVKWLKTIYKCDLGGILADEMGLGKSIQTITFIKQILKEKKDAKIIIVVPTSLIYNWQKEFDKFAPNLKYVVVADNKQKRKEIFNKKDEYNIFITSYGLIRNDKDEYENVNFELCVVDEAQNIKNYQANMTKEIKKIKAKCKIALTGTPLENNVTELWSIFDFIMPGYLNTVLKFKEKYNIKDIDEENLKIIKNLNYQITPFILRRKKQEVIKSLPEKIENNIYIDLPEKQKMLYLKVLEDTKKEMDEMIGNEGFLKSKMKILQLLTKLRQICIDPNVMYENYNGESIKIDELLRVVKENTMNGHKILIFSSFKRVLENVKNIFYENNITYYMIDGSVKSKERMNLVESFNNDDTNCFLITLKSGGTGLNLTGADTVIHLDIWWNPQVENQATDRAHRIGQTKTVSVIKLITKGTIEDKIIELQEKKKLLSDNLIEGKNNSDNLFNLTEKDIKNLLANNE